MVRWSRCPLLPNKIIERGVSWIIYFVVRGGAPRIEVVGERRESSWGTRERRERKGRRNTTKATKRTNGAVFLAAPRWNSRGEEPIKTTPFFCFPCGRCIDAVVVVHGRHRRRHCCCRCCCCRRSSSSRSAQWRSALPTILFEPSLESLKVLDILRHLKGSPQNGFLKNFGFFPVLDKSLDLENFSKRNYSWFPLSSWRSEISCLVLLSIFKILKNHFSFSSRFSRFLYWTSLSPLDFQDFVEQFLFLLSIFKIL